MLNLATNSLRLDEEKHQYWLNGKRIPGLSELLKHFGFIDDAYYTEDGREVGRAVHMGTESMDLGRQEHLQFTNKAIIGRIMAWERFKQDKQFHPTSIETIHAHPYGTYGTRIDRLGFFRESPVEALIELKCGGKEAWHKLQTGGQDAALGPSAPRRRFALYLRPDETYNLVEHTDRTDAPVFVSLASAYTWKQNNGYKIP